MQSELPRPISWISVKSDLGCTSRIYLDNVTPTSQKPCEHTIKSVIAAKQTARNEVYVFYSDILLNFIKLFFILLIKLLDLNRAEPTCYRTSIPYGSSS